MSTNKIMALIGAITYTFMPFLALFIGLSAATFSTSGASTGSLSTLTPEQIQEGTVFWVFIGVLTLGIAVCNWLGFAFIDGKRGKGWKIYLLVSGILACVSIICLIPGVFFILAFALKGKTESTPLVTTDSWNATASSILGQSEDSSALTADKSSESQAVTESQSTWSV